MIDDDQPPPANIAPLKPTGDLVAVAIRGEFGAAGGMPKVIASGRGKVAEEILKLAHAKGLRVREDGDLAQLLARLDLDTPIPSEAIIAVAEILARVYAANGRLLHPVQQNIS
jgi:flagellar biosynthesis protein